MNPRQSHGFVNRDDGRLELPSSERARYECPQRGGAATCARLLAINASYASIDCMASITIRNLDDETKARLRLRAARHQRSMEEEARTVLRQALAVPDAPAISLAAAIRSRFQSLGGVELELPSRDAIREPPKPAK